MLITANKMIINHAHEAHAMCVCMYHTVCVCVCVCVCMCVSHYKKMTDCPRAIILNFHIKSFALYFQLDSF